MTSIVSSNHYVAKLEINLHIINFCHDYFILCDTGIMVEIVLGELGRLGEDV